MKKQNILTVLFLFVLFGLLIQLGQYWFPFYQQKKLSGSFKKAERPEFNWASWFEGEFQDKFSLYFEDNFGFHNFFIKINNQIAYSIFKQVFAKKVIVGKKNFLYEYSYIKAYTGEDFIGKHKIKEKIKKIKFIQDTLKSKDIDLIVILAPGKGSFYPEYIPESYLKNGRTKTNYEGYLEELEAENINFIDFRKWFLDNKEKSKYPLFPQTGIHWSRYGEVLVGDSILGYIGKLRNIDMPRIIIDSIFVSRKPKFTDNDIEKSLNIFEKLSHIKLAYPSYHKKPADHPNNVKTMFVSDSYYWGLYSSNYSINYLNNGSFWYYGRLIYEPQKNTEINASEVDIINEVEKNKVVVLMATDANLKKFVFGFIDELYAAYHNTISLHKKRILSYEDYLKNDSALSAEVMRRAIKKGITFKKSLRLVATYMIWKEDQVKNEKMEQP